jgi:GT2 family glycosyltransferase
LIDVVIPVYKGPRQTRVCLESVLGARHETPIEVVVVDDASPEPAIREYLRGLAHGGQITLLTNEANLGFVQSVNRGMSLHEDRDVILLNSDTEVANDWVDRLRAAAYAGPRIATVTPFSNNATICSYPFERWDGGVPGTLGLAALDRVFAAANAGKRIDLPTAVGFCMLIRRECLEQIGMFDAERFGRGYGEENDFCMRASKAGWRNLLAADVFIFHEGSVSFREERWALMQAAAPALFEVHPDYPLRVHEFIEADEASALRAAVDRARAQHDAEESRHVLEERLKERAIIVGDLHALLRKSWDHEDHVARLRGELGHANAEREAIAAQARKLASEVESEMRRLRAGLSHAESLAFSRQRELDDIHSFWLWRSWSYLMRRKHRGVT